MDKRWWGWLVVAGLLGWLIVPNLADARLTLFAWEVRAPLALWLLGAFALGAGVGLVAGRRR